MPALTRRQAAAYRETFSIWRAPVSVNATTGVPADFTYTRASSLNYGIFEFTQNDSDPVTGVGRVKRRSGLTEDRLRCHVDIDLQDGDLIYNSTSGDPNAGIVWKVAGEPTKYGTRGRRVIEEQSVMCETVANPPSEVSS